MCLKKLPNDGDRIYITDIGACSELYEVRHKLTNKWAEVCGTLYYVTERPFRGSDYVYGTIIFLESGDKICIYGFTYTEHDNSLDWILGITK